MGEQSPTYNAYVYSSETHSARLRAHIGYAEKKKLPIMSHTSSSASAASAVSTATGGMTPSAQTPGARSCPDFSVQHGDHFDQRERFDSNMSSMSLPVSPVSRPGTRGSDGGISPSKTTRDKQRKMFPPLCKADLLPKEALSGTPGPRHGSIPSPNLHPRQRGLPNSMGSASLVCWRETTDDIRRTHRGVMRGTRAPTAWRLTLLMPEARKASAAA